ncbi:alpha/beta fold hydrolase [Sphaerisporangium corydalis]|uniref:Alpha/beta fold hydrolase n=1 Tax=Sphaerisporangium corydalis TaxID=1441875 RepID=A0ABV9EDJ4_9ACTN|nr:alpha/beta hydrolase [Sphaerisporangium corydalis]
MGELLVVPVNGIRMACEVAGDEGAPPVMLLAGRGYGRADWAGVMGKLAPSWRVYAPDLRGHGDSEWPGVYGLELMRDDVIALLDHLGGARVALVAHSLGGVVACLVAHERPDLVDRLVLEDVPALRPADVPIPQRPAGTLPYDWAMIEQTAAERRNPDPAWVERLSEITAPTLVIAGGAASHVSQESVAEVAARIPGARLVTIEAGHDVHATRPADFLAVLTDFLGH